MQQMCYSLVVRSTDQKRGDEMLGLQVAIEVATAEIWLRLGWWLGRSSQGFAAERVNVQLWALWNDRSEWLEPACR